MTPTRGYRLRPLRPMRPATTAAALMLGACASSTVPEVTDHGSSTAVPAAPVELDPALTREARALLDSSPIDWKPRFDAVVARGAPMAAALAAEVRRALNEVPPPRGLFFAVGALDTMTGPDATDALRWIARSPSPVAADAALALGTRPDDERTRALLRELSEDQARSETLRAAAAASLLRLGHGRAVRDLLEAILLAGTPPGSALAEAQGLPSKPRWALERSYVLQAMQARAGQRFGLDTDASWGQLREGAERFLAWLEEDGGAPE